MRRESVTLLLVSILLNTSCDHRETSQQLDGFSDYLENIGYSFYNPPRSDRGPGSVFRFVDLEGGSRGLSPVCRDLFPDIEPTRAEVSIPNENRTEELELGFVLELLKGLLTDETPVDASMKREMRVEVKFSDDVQSLSYFEEDAINDDGTPRKLSPTCYARLKSLSETGQLAEGVFFVQDALRVREAEYQFSRSYDFGAHIDIPITKILHPKAEVSSESKVENSLTIREWRFVAFKAMLVTEFVDTGLTSAGSAIIRGRPLTVDEFSRDQ